MFRFMYLFSLFFHVATSNVDLRPDCAHVRDSNPRLLTKTTLLQMPGWKVRDMIDRIDRDQQKTSNHIVGGQRKLSYGEFEHVSRIFLHT
jgi:hypothetical protein